MGAPGCLRRCGHQQGDGPPAGSPPGTCSTSRRPTTAGVAAAQAGLALDRESCRGGPRNSLLGRRACRVAWALRAVGLGVADGGSSQARRRQRKPAGSDRSRDQPALSTAQGQWAQLGQGQWSATRPATLLSRRPGAAATSSCIARPVLMVSPPLPPGARDRSSSARWAWRGDPRASDIHHPSALLPVGGGCPPAGWKHVRARSLTKSGGGLIGYEHARFPGPGSWPSHRQCRARGRP